MGKINTSQKQTAGLFQSASVVMFVVHACFRGSIDDFEVKNPVFFVVKRH